MVPQPETGDRDGAYRIRRPRCANHRIAILSMRPLACGGGPATALSTCRGGVESFCRLLILNGHYFSPISLATVGSIAADQIS